MLFKYIIFENKEVEKMQEYRMIQITKEEIVPTALRDAARGQVARDDPRPGRA